MAAPHPRMHGLTHVCGGADPIPGICDFINPGVPVDDYSVIVPSVGGGTLRGYWRLGESAAPFLDTSGYDTVNSADMTRNTYGVPMTLDATGAIGAAHDDGAVTQNYAGTDVPGTAADFLEGINAGDRRFSFDPGVGENMSVAVWVKPLASASTWLGGIVAAYASGIVGAPSYDGGWALYMSWPTREIVFWRGGAGRVAQSASGGVLPADTWSHVAATYDNTSIRLYVNGGLAATVASTVDLPGTGRVAVGYINPVYPPLGSGTGYTGRFYGSIDEAAVWAAALTAAEVAELYAATGDGTASAGTIPVSDGTGGVTWGQIDTISIADGAVTTTKIDAGPAGYTLKSDGSTVSWALPTIRVNY